MTEEDRRDAILSEQQLLMEQGVSAGFARKATLAAPKDMWFPDMNELLSEHVVTQVVDATNYAISGLGQDRLTADQIESMLLATPLYAAIKKEDPQSYAVILNEFSDGIRQGKTVKEMAGVISPAVENVWSQALPYASSQDLLSYFQFMIKEMSALNRSDPAECYFLVRPEETSAAQIIDIRQRHKDLTDEELELKSNVLNNYSKAIALPSEADVANRLDSIIAKLKVRRDIDADLLEDKSLAPAKYGAFCNTLIALYMEILKLPSKESVDLLRVLLTSK
jgi:hypothetical protein